MDSTVSDFHSTFAAWDDRAEALLGDPAPNVVALLDTIQEGIRLRRRLDDAGAESLHTCRHELIARLCRLQDHATSLLASPALERQAREVVAQHAETFLERSRKYVNNVVISLDLDPVAQGRMLVAFQDDLQWAAAMVACLDGESPPEPASAISARLDQVQRSLSPQSPDDEAAEQRERAIQMRRQLLQRRIEVEIARPADSSTSVEAWGRRLMLTRLQAEVETLAAEESALGRRQDPRTGEWIASLTEHRGRLADLASRKLQSLGAENRYQAWDAVVMAARGDSTEVVSLLEEVSLSNAVILLELSRQDLLRLARVGEELLAQPPAPADPEFDVAPLVERVEGMARLARNELQEKRLRLRMTRALGQRFVSLLEGSVLLLILVITVMIIVETTMEASVELTPGQLTFFAWADLAICAVFLFEFFLKLSFAPPADASDTGLFSRYPKVRGKWVYFWRHFLVDFLASIPFGFLTHQFSHVGSISLEEGRWQWLRFVLPSLARFAKIARPSIRVARVLIFSLRAADRLVRRYAWLFNRKIVLFEPEDADEEQQPSRQLLVVVRDVFARRALPLLAGLSEPARLQVMQQTLGDLDVRLANLPSAPPAVNFRRPPDQREIRVEAVVQRLIEMTPEQIVDSMGPAFAESVKRSVRLLDIPLVRRLPLIRELVANREKSAGEAAPLTANYVGYFIQTWLNLIYYLADLHGTISAPVFFDRLGSTLVKATATPTRRLLILGVVVFSLYGVVWLIEEAGPLRSLADTMWNRLGFTVVTLGLICSFPLLLGIWLRRIANQAAEFCERVVEAQFVTQTRAVKQQHAAQDADFLQKRVIGAELTMRHSDDQMTEAGFINADPQDVDDQQEEAQKAEELLFLRNIHLLYQDYLDGSIFHKNDTKTTTQLLGNLALHNLRSSCLAHSVRDSKRLRALDLSRSAGALLGGPYLWFNYITRLLTQQTAKLLVDYNRNAIPLRQLACSSRQARGRYRAWLARRLDISEDEVYLPDPVGRFGDQDATCPNNRRSQAEEFFETVDFNAVDFLTDTPERDTELRVKYGDQVAELVRRDRQLNVRRAFRGFPLHRFPPAQRTLNPFTIYETYLAGGQALLLPLRIVVAWWRLVCFVARRLARMIADMLRLQIGEDDLSDFDTYAVARRKIHRMRKPMFMESLWLRARFDVEYAGLSIPGLPAAPGGRSMLETDLDFIGASRRERLVAHKLQLEHQQRLLWIDKWLADLGWSLQPLSGYLAIDFPYLEHRSAEVVRALVAAFVLDHDDVYTLSCSIEGLRRMMAHGSDAENDRRDVPAGLPTPVDRRQPRWYFRRGKKRRWTELFNLPCFPQYDREAQLRALRYLKRHKGIVRGWADVVLNQGGSDPIETLRERLRSVIRRTYLWSDQIIALRTIQTLTILDVYHYCEMVWKLGGYDALEQSSFHETLPYPVEILSLPAEAAPHNGTQNTALVPS